MLRPEMIMIRKAFAVVLSALAVAAPALAQDPATGTTQMTGEARYGFNKVDEGFLRLDRQTGEVSMCGRQTVGWACIAVPEDRAVLENEIARLRRDNAALKENLLSRGLPLPAGVMPEPAASGDKDVTLPLPSNADIDRMVAAVGQMWHRLVEAIANAQNQLLHKS
jgi:hypothetical protein